MEKRLITVECRVDTVEQEVVQSTEGALYSKETKAFTLKVDYSLPCFLITFKSTIPCYSIAFVVDSSSIRGTMASFSYVRVLEPTTEFSRVF